MGRLADMGLGRIALRCACAVLCLLIVGADPDMVAASTAPSVPYLNPPPGKNWYQKDWVDTVYGMKRAKSCVDNMESNGLDRAIVGVWGSNPGADVGRAIACHEGNGRVGALEYKKSKGEGGVCAFQIDKASGYPAGAKNLGVSVDKFVDLIMTDPVSCAKAGHFVFTGFSNRKTHGIIGAKCNYFGGAHYQQFVKFGNCAMADELNLVVEYINAYREKRPASIQAVPQDNPDEPCYGCVKLTGPSIGTVAVLNCHDYSGEFSSDIAKANLAFQDALKIASRYDANLAQNAQAKYPTKNAFMDVEKYYCIGKIHDFLDSLKSLLDGSLVDLVVGFILGLLEDLLNAACQLVVDAINTVLKMVCVPLPKLGLPNFKLPGLDGASCDGISLNDYISVSRGDDISLMPDGAPTNIPRTPDMLGRIIRKAPEQTLFQF